MVSFLSRKSRRPENSLGCESARSSIVRSSAHLPHLPGRQRQSRPHLEPPPLSAKDTAPHTRPASGCGRDAPMGKAMKACASGPRQTRQSAPILPWPPRPKVARALAPMFLSAGFRAATLPQRLLPLACCSAISTKTRFRERVQADAWFERREAERSSTEQQRRTAANEILTLV